MVTLYWSLIHCSKQFSSYIYILVCTLLTTNLAIAATNIHQAKTITMANIFRFFLKVVGIIIIFATVLFVALYLFVRSIPRILGFYSPITTAEFLELIETKNPTSHYNSVMNDQSEECSVCLSTFENGEELRKLKQCNHSFHKHCLDTWFRHDHTSCPLCRASALPERIVAGYRLQHDTQVCYGGKEEFLMLLSALHHHFLTRSARPMATV